MGAYLADLPIPADEPSAIGHFPGNPIVPGAVLLREVMRILARDDEANGCEIRSARFYHPVRPGDCLTMSWDTSADGVTSFTCSMGTAGQTVLSGTLRLRPR